MSNGRPSLPERRLRREWGLLLLALGLVGLLLALERAADHRRTAALERARLSAAAMAVESNLVQQLRSTRAALEGVVAEAAATGLQGTPPVPVARLALLADVMPGVRTLSVVDLQGRVRASNRPELLGVDVSSRDYLRDTIQAAADPQAAPLRVSPPFRTLLDVVVINLSLPVRAADGRLLGVAAATLDPAYFSTLLKSELYAEGMWGWVTHGDGDVLLYVPEGVLPAGANLRRPGTLFQRHLDSGRDASIFDDVLEANGERRLIAQRNVRPPDLGMSAPLVLAVSRPSADVHAGWSRQALLTGALWLMLASASVLAMRALQRQDRAAAERAREREAEREVEAGRLQLALAGADLALWDLDLVSGACTVNPRWFEMLGEQPGSIATDADAWYHRIHPDDRDAVRECALAHQAGDSAHYAARYRVRHADGRWIWLLDQGRVVERGPDGAARRMVGTHMDVTASHEAEQALRASEQRLAITLDSIGDAVVATDRDGRITRFNAAAVRLSGWSAAEAQGRPLAEVFRVFNARTRELQPDPVAEVLASGETVALTNDTMLLTRDGRELQIADSAAPIRDAGGAIAGVVLVFSDVSGHYRMVQALRQSEESLRGLLDALLAGVVRHGPDTAVRSANPAACRILGLTLKQMMGRQAMHPDWRFVEADGRPMALERFPVKRVLAEGHVLDGYVGGVCHPERADITWVLVNAFPIRGEGGAIDEVVVTFVDITELHTVQQRLRLLEAAIERLNDVVIITEAEPLAEPGPRIVFVNPAFERLTGWSAADALGRSPRMLQGPDTDRAELARISQALAQGESVRSELVNHHRDGHPYWTELEIVPLRDTTGRLTHFVAVQRDISARKDAEARLHEARRDLAATLDAVPDLLFEVDADGVILGHHSPRRELLLLAPEQFLGRSMHKLMPPDVAEVVAAALDDARRDGYSQGRQYALSLPDGLRWFELSVARKPMPEGQLPRFILLARDITDRQQAEAERRELERRLAEAQKLESVNTLAGGIAHEFNNLVPAILGNVAMARDDVPPGHPAQEALAQIQRAALRARTMVQQILDFSRSRPPQLKVQRLRPVIAETLALLRSTLPASVRLAAPPELQPGEAPLLVRADATQLQQVLMNLCINAWQAMPDGRGRIEVGLDAAAVAPLPLPGAGEAGAVHLWVRDDGAGMDEATRQRIFEPFFTTKPVGQGTGLGLAVVHALVASHGGAIDVDSAPGQGTTFHLWFPRVADAAAAEREASDAAALDEPAAAEAAESGKGRRIVYIDDDEVMRLMVQRLLERQGWLVTVFDAALPALAWLEDPRHGAELVVTDFHMPELSGLAFAERLARVRPGLPVVLSTGHVTPEIAAGARHLGVRALLHKENTLEELGPLLRRVLDEGRG